MICPVCQSANLDTATICQVCAAPLGAIPPTTPDALTAGTRLQGGALIINEVLGIGGFGITYRGQDTPLHRAVAVKEFFPYGCKREGQRVRPPAAMPDSEFQTARQRFLDEAKTLAHFHHPGIVDVYTLFEENNTAYMVMEFLPGRTLLRVMEETPGGLSETEAIAYIKQAGAALQEVHRAGMLHRDIKPENIMVCGDGRVVLIDFGTAREYMAGRTQRHSVVVTPGYAPLEQYAQRAQRGTYTDVYALAATLYYLLTGQIPDAASDRAMGVQLTPIRQFNARVSASVVAAVEAGLSIEVNRRPQRVEDLLQLLDRPATNPATTQAPPTPLRKPMPPPSPATDRELSQYLTAMTTTEVVPSSPPTLHRQDGYWKVKVSDGNVNWPDMCACCGAPSTATVLLEDSTGMAPHRWAIPYCTSCQQHVRKARHGDEMYLSCATIIGIECLRAMTVVDSGPLAYPVSIPEIVVVAVLVLLCGVRGRIAEARAHQLRGQQCHATGRAVRHQFINYHKQHAFVFHSKEFAEAFVACNKPGVPASNQP